MSGSRADTLRGNAADNILTSGNGNDQIFGSAGNDILYGGNGNDLLQGDSGNDILEGGLGKDTAIYVGSAASVDLSVIGAQVTGHGIDTLFNIENVTSGVGSDILSGNNFGNVLDGGDGNDWLKGLGGSDRIFGGFGSDTLDGGSGRDTISGGAGSDVFVFNTGSDFDVVSDFLNGTDHIQIVTGAEKFSDIRVTDYGSKVLIQFSDVTLTLLNVDHTVIGAEDFVFL